MVDLTRHELGVPVVRVVVPLAETWAAFHLHSRRGTLGPRAVRRLTGGADQMNELVTLCSATLGEDGNEPPLGPLYVAAALERLGAESISGIISSAPKPTASPESGLRISWRITPRSSPFRASSTCCRL